MSGAKHGLISLFVVVCLWTQLSVQLQFRLGEYLGRFGQAAGLLTYWRMFTPTVKFRWKVRYYAIYRDGSYELLPLPSQSARRWWERAYIDFREVKTQVNILEHDEGLHTYATHLCQSYGAVQPIRTILVQYTFQPMLSPEEADKQGRHLSEQITSSQKKFGCSK